MVPPCCTARCLSWPGPPTDRSSWSALPARPCLTCPAAPPSSRTRARARDPSRGSPPGSTALAGQAEAAFISSTDLPFLHPAFIRRVVGGLGRARSEDGVIPDVCLPVARGYPQPLAAAYRVALAGTVGRLVTEGRLRPAFLFEECVVSRLDDATLKADPHSPRSIPSSTHS